MQGTTKERIKLQALAAELGKDIKAEADLNALPRLRANGKSSKRSRKCMTPTSRSPSFPKPRIAY